MAKLLTFAALINLMSVRYYLIPLYLLLFSGCAGLSKGGLTTTTITTEPPNAVVRVNGTERGNTPFTYTYDPEDGDKVLFDLELAGYDKTEIMVRPKRNNTVLFMDAMLLQIPYIVDQKSPKMYSLPRQDYKLKLFKERNKDEERILVPVTGADVTTFDKSIGTLNNKAILTSTDPIAQDLKDTDLLALAMVNGLRETWVDARSVRKGTTKGDETIQKAKLYLRPKVQMIAATLIGPRKASSGMVEVEVDWQFFSSLRKDSLLFSRTTRTTYNPLEENSRNIVGHALEEAGRWLTEDPTLKELISTNMATVILANKGDEMRMKTPLPIPFEGRKDMLAALVKAVVTISTDKGHGSGFMISNDGYLVTNAHVVENQTTPKVKFEQGFTLDAQVVKLNKDMDLALLKVPATDLPALKIGKDAELMLGEEIFAIGTPLDAKLGQSVSRGVLSGKREIEGRTFLQTDVSINPGNSGGPFLDETGAVVGMATMKISGKGLEGLGFGVPISVILEMLNITFVP